jgi:hypothetical protein
MLNRDYILLFMIFSYLMPIILICNYYNSNSSISNIICNENNKNIILCYMVLMGGGSILYELERGDKISIFLIFLMLIGIYGLICINENNIVHYIFALLVFFTIISFMIRHYYNNNVLFISLLLEIIMLLIIINNISINKNIFFSEVIYILNFAFYYLYLHFI